MGRPDKTGFGLSKLIGGELGRRGAKGEFKTPNGFGFGPRFKAKPGDVFKTGAGPGPGPKPSRGQGPH